MQKRQPASHKRTDSDIPTPLAHWEAFQADPKLPSAWKIGQNGASEQVELSEALHSYHAEKEKAKAKTTLQSAAPPVSSVANFGLAPQLRYDADKNEYEVVGRNAAQLTASDNQELIPPAQSTSANDIARVGSTLEGSAELMRLPNADRYLKQKQYDAAENVLGRPLDCEELQRGWLIPPQRCGVLTASDMPRAVVPEKQVQTVVLREQQAAQRVIDVERARAQAHREADEAQREADDAQHEADEQEQKQREEARNAADELCDQQRHDNIEENALNLINFIAEQGSDRKVLQQQRVKDNIEAYRNTAAERLSENFQTYVDLYPELSKIDEDFLKLTFKDESKIADFLSQIAPQGDDNDSEIDFSANELAKMNLNELLAAITEQLHEIEQHRLADPKRIRTDATLTPAEREAKVVDTLHTLDQYRRMLQSTYRNAAILKHADEFKHSHSISSAVWKNTKKALKLLGTAASATAHLAGTPLGSIAATAALGYAAPRLDDLALMVGLPGTSAMREFAQSQMAPAAANYLKGRVLMEQFHPNTMWSAAKADAAARLGAEMSGATAASNAAAAAARSVGSATSHTLSTVAGWVDGVSSSLGYKSDVSGAVNSALHTMQQSANVLARAAPTVSSLTGHAMDANAYAKVAQDTANELSTTFAPLVNVAKTLASLGTSLSPAMGVIGEYASAGVPLVGSAAASLARGITRPFNKRYEAARVQMSQNKQLARKLKSAVRRATSSLIEQGVDGSALAPLHAASEEVLKIVDHAANSVEHVKALGKKTAKRKQARVKAKASQKRKKVSRDEDEDSDATSFYDEQDDGDATPTYDDDGELVQPVLPLKRRRTSKRSRAAQSGSGVDGEYGAACGQADGDRLMIMLGEIDAGNDSFTMYRDLKKLLTKMERERRLPLTLIRRIRSTYIHTHRHHPTQGRR